MCGKWVDFENWANFERIVWIDDSGFLFQHDQLIDL